LTKKQFLIDNFQNKAGKTLFVGGYFFSRNVNRKLTTLSYPVVKIASKNLNRILAK